MASFEEFAFNSRPQVLIRERRRCVSLLRRLLSSVDGIDSAVAADKLVKHFGSMRAALAASPQEQFVVVDDARVVRHLSVVRSSIRWVLRDEVVERTPIASPEALRNYVRFSYGCDPYEQVRVFYLNASGRLISEVSFERGGRDTAIADPAQIIGRGRDLGAKLLVMAHNHPSGDPTPSYDDRRITTRVATGADIMGMKLYDHLIVAEGRDFSFREAGFL